MGKQFSLRSSVRKLDGAKLSKLSPEHQRMVGRFLGATDGDGVGVLNRLDSDAVEDVMGVVARCAGGGAAPMHAAGAVVTTAGAACPWSGQKWYTRFGESDLPADVLDRHAGIISSLSGETQELAMRLVATNGDDGIRAINRLVDADDADFGRTLRRMDDLGQGARTGAVRAISDGVPADRVSKSLSRLDGSDLREQYQRLLSHQDSNVRNSWLRQSGRADLRSNAFEKALKRVQAVKDSGHRIKQFRSAKEANEILGYENPPFTSRTIVGEFDSKNKDVFARVHREGNQAKGFMMREKEIRGLSKHQIEDKFSLPDTPKYVSDVEVPQNTKMWVDSTFRK